MLWVRGCTWGGWWRIGIWNREYLGQQGGMDLCELSRSMGIVLSSATAIGDGMAGLVVQNNIYATYRIVRGSTRLLREGGRHSA